MVTVAGRRRNALAGGLLVSLAGPGFAEEADPFRTSIAQEVSAGGMVRLLKRDPGLIGGGKGGTRTSGNYDDGKPNHRRGLTAAGLQGRTAFDGASASGDLKLEAVYFY